MKTRAAFLGLLLLFGVVTFGLGNASAQQKKKFVWKPGTSKYTQTHVIDVGDVPNHQLRLFELHTRLMVSKSKSASPARYQTTSTAAARRRDTRSTFSRMVTRSLSA
jgi:hypothetical protein